MVTYKNIPLYKYNNKKGELIVYTKEFHNKYLLKSTGYE